jgi:uncharacterized protein (DUF1800 family)
MTDTRHVTDLAQRPMITGEQPTEDHPTVQPEAPDGEAPGTGRASRRALLLAPASALVAAACATSPPTSGPPPASGVQASAELVVNKLTFGPKPTLVDWVKKQGVNNWIEQQLGRIDGSAESIISDAAFQTLRNTNNANWAVQDADGTDPAFHQLDHATLIRQIVSDQQLYEVMCDFWSNHFNIWRQHSYLQFLRNRDNETVIRPHAFGKFKDMLLASAHSPAMMDYLDNRSSNASSPGGVNQNYARELLELHTLGIINGTQVYNESDVQACAQIMSGWSIEWNNVPTKYDFKFVGSMHDRRAVSAFGGAVSFPARASGQGYNDGLVLLDYLAHHPSTAKYIAFKLVRRFVSDDPPMGLVNSAAAVFTANDTAIVPTLRHIFQSAEFASSGLSKIRRPHEHMVAMLRALGASFSYNPNGRSADAMRRALDDMGQPLHERVTPDGYPEIAPLWVSSNALLERWEVAARIARNQLGDVSMPTDKVAVNIAALLPNPLPATVWDLLSWIGVYLANINMPAADINDLCTAIGANAGSASTTLTTNASRFGLAVGLIFSHPLFQRR